MPDRTRDYLKQLGKGLKEGDATGHRYRPHLKSLIESFGENVRAINKPRRVKCEEPYLAIQKKHTLLGYYTESIRGLTA